METIRRNRSAFKQQHGRPVGVGVCLRLAHPSFLLVSGQQSPCFFWRVKSTSWRVSSSHLGRTKSIICKARRPPTAVARRTKSYVRRSGQRPNADPGPSRWTTTITPSAPWERLPQRRGRLVEATTALQASSASMIKPRGCSSDSDPSSSACGPD